MFQILQICSYGKTLAALCADGSVWWLDHKETTITDWVGGKPVWVEIKAKIGEKR